MEQHGRIRWQDIAATLADQPSCPKLKGYWLFEDCGNRKNTDTCANPQHRPDCPLPRHDLRNGRLDQTDYSIYLLVLDLADGSIVDWIDVPVANVTAVPPAGRAARVLQ